MFGAQTQSMKIDIEKIAKQHKYCSICGGELEYKGKTLLICKNCGYHKFLNPVMCSSAILENNNHEILLVERGVEPSIGKLDFPGGFYDLQENAEEGMIREIKEELKIEVKDLKYTGSYIDMYSYQGIESQVLALVFTGNIGEQKIIPTDDVSGFKFFKPEEIPYSELAFAGMEAALKDYIKNR